MRFRPSRAILVLLGVLLQACNTYTVAAKPPGEVLAETPFLVRVTTNEGKTTGLKRPVVRSGYVVEVGHDSVRLSDVKQVEVAKLDRTKTALFVLAVVALGLVVGFGPGASQDPDPGTPITPVLIRWP